MMFVDLDDIHIPVTGGLVPVAWANGIAANFDHMVRAPHIRMSVSDDARQVIAPDEIVPVEFTRVFSYTGDVLADVGEAVDALAVPYTGSYVCAMNMKWDAAAFDSDSTVKAAVQINEGALRLGVSNNIACRSVTLGGLLTLTAGDALSFVILHNVKDAGDPIDINASAYASLVYMGGA